MAVDQENVSRVLSVLSHKLRREIILILNEKGETSFTDLMNTLGIDTGKLSFHLRNLSMFIEQTKTGKYRLSRAGENAVRLVKDVESWTESADVAGRASLLPLASFKRRAYAFLFDFSIMFAITASFLLQNFLSPGTWQWLIGLVNILFATLGVVWIYCTLLEGFIGQSLGKRVFGLKVVKTDGKKMDYDHAAVRNFGKVLLPFDLVFGYRLNDPRFIRYFDKFAGTTVIDLRKHLLPEGEIT